MTLRYYFGGYNDAEPFEKDLDLGDIETYLRTLPANELAELVQEGFELLDSDERFDILTDMGEPNFACPDYKRWVRDEWDFCVELVTDDSILVRLGDELHDFFEDEAGEEYAEQHSGADPMRAVGMRQKDFL
jgi:hypothetical protein